MASHNSMIIRWFSTIRLSRLIVFVLLALIVLPLFIHYYLTKFVSVEVNHISNEVPSDLVNHPLIVSMDELTAAQQIEDYRMRVIEMMRIRNSINSELRSLESKRQKLQADIAVLTSKVDQLKQQLSKKQVELERAHVSLEQAQYAQKEASLINQPFIGAPLQLFPQEAQGGTVEDNSIQQTSSTCRMFNCFDYSRCSLTSSFYAYFYQPDDNLGSLTAANSEIPADLKRVITNALSNNVHITFDPNIACIYIVLLINPLLNKSILENYLHSLQYWRDGRNHVIINLDHSVNLISLQIDFGKALIVQTKFSLNQFRHTFDIVLPVLIPNSQAEFFSPLSSQTLHCPARRRYFVSYQGNHDRSESFELREIIMTLNKISRSSKDSFLLDFNCKSGRDCANLTQVLHQSTFSLILPPNDTDAVADEAVAKKFYTILKFGAIPVLIGGDRIMLPFQEVVDWKRAVVYLPVSRVPEIHFLLSSFTDNDVLEMRRQGQLLFHRYIYNVQSVVNTILAIIRHSRLQIPPLGLQDEQSVNIYNDTSQMNFFEVTNSALNPDSAEPDENLGPIEPPFSSPKFTRNFSNTLIRSYFVWNDNMFDPFYLYPFTPFDSILPSEAKFIGSSYGFRPIGNGAGGSGKEFNEALGGNLPKEQFTIVMLTYEREAVLIDSLQRLRGLPHLNKIVVVWNSPNHMPSPDLRWPDVGVNVKVIKSKRNSLNNRFLPYDDIETEAILSMDDDAHLRHDEIIFGFRVWRESRERIVGFPGRFHAWDNKHKTWQYNSNYSCELSMVLTGAAFFHKYYTYIYSNSMSKLILDKVDEYMNCEDIAMNFLVSHITRKPPIKVTSRWTFRCPGCPLSLSEDDSHFQERHKCLNFFASVYGYMPLLSTQFRADSVLFKTRIPHDKQKCFKFI